MRASYKHFCSEERLRLYSLLLEGLSIEEIANQLGFHRSTIYRELHRNSSKLGYRPDIASQQYLLRRRYKVCKLERQEELQNHIINKLKEGWSPEQIAGRLKKESGNTIISHEAIYQYIYGTNGKMLKLHLYLKKKRSYRYPRTKRRRKKAYNDKLSIHERSEQVNSRAQFGHWEGDLVLFRKTQTNLFTLRERKTRFLVSIKNASRQAQSTSKSLVNYMQKQLFMIKTLTLDNDPAFAKYKELSKELGATLYFCDPYKSWQKGSIENGNRLFREIMHRNFRINDVDQESIDKITSNINNRPMKILGYMTPQEAFLQEKLQMV